MFDENLELLSPLPFETSMRQRAPALAVLPSEKYVLWTFLWWLYGRLFEITKQYEVASGC